MNAIHKFIAGLTDNQRKLLFLAIVIVVAALFDRLLIGPTMTRLSSIEEDIAKEQASIRQDMRFLSYKDRITQESKEIAPYLTTQISSQEEMISAFLRKLEGLAVKAKVNLIKINPGPGEQDAEYWKYKADLECSGNLADVIVFMHLINSDMDLMKVVKYNFSGKKSETDEIKATMTVEKIVVPDKPMPPMPKEANAPATSAPSS